VTMSSRFHRHQFGCGQEGREAERRLRPPEDLTSCRT
jgi:hypothetical protein